MLRPGVRPVRALLRLWDFYNDRVEADQQYLYEPQRDKGP